MTENEVIEKIINQASQLRTDREKYQYIYNWFIKNCQYNYEYLDSYKRWGSVKKEQDHMINRMPYLVDLNNRYNNGNLDIESLTTDQQENFKKFLEVKKSVLEAQENWRQAPENNPFITGMAICGNFSSAYKQVCDKLNLNCEKVTGTILSKGFNCGHAWNIVKIDGEVKHIDISYGIHNRDDKRDPSEYFLLSTEELLEKDKQAERKLEKVSLDTIEKLQQKEIGKVETRDND